MPGARDFKTRLISYDEFFRPATLHGNGCNTVRSVVRVCVFLVRHTARASVHAPDTLVLLIGPDESNHRFAVPAPKGCIRRVSGPCFVWRDRVRRPRENFDVETRVKNVELV